MTDNNAQARAQLLVLKGVISELPDDEQAKVKATAQRIRAILEEDRKANGMAEASRSSTGCNRAERRRVMKVRELKHYKFVGLYFTWWLTLGWREDENRRKILLVGPIGFVFARRYR